MQQLGDIDVLGEDVAVRLARMDAPQYAAALRALCDELNPRAPLDGRIKLW